MSIEKVVIMIPTYNESLVIEETLFAIFRETASILQKEIHVLVFDSASMDDTQAIVSRMQKTNPRLHLKTEDHKSGLGSAYLQAMRYALQDMSADIVVEFDADLSHQPKYLAPMLEQLTTHDVVLGSRYIKGGSIPREWGWHRKLLSVLGNYTARFLLSSKYKDFTSGFRATHRRVLARVLPEQFLSNHYAYKIELLWLLHKNNARIFEFPIEFVDRQKGDSKLPSNSVVDSLRVLFLLRTLVYKRYIQMCLVGLLGVSIQCVLYNVLRAQQVAPIYAMQFSAIAAIINNFLLNNHVTFKKNRIVHRYQKIKSLGFFIGYSFLMVSFQSYWLHLGITFFGSGALKENIIIFSGIFIGSFVSYQTYSRLIWRDKKTNASFVRLDNKPD